MAEDLMDFIFFSGTSQMQSPGFIRLRSLRLDPHPLGLPGWAIFGMGACPIRKLSDIGLLLVKVAPLQAL